MNNDLEAKEDFIGFYEIPNLKSSTIDTVIKDALIRLQLSLSLNECRGQCYDGASNMVGKNSGVAVKIQEKQTKAFATHCHCHSLSLSVKDATKNCTILENTMNTSKEIVTLIKFPPKRENMLGTVTQNIEGDSADQAPGVSKFSVTRWTIRAVCFNRIYLKYQELQSTWDECLEEGGMNSELKAGIICCKAQMGTFDYFFGLQLGYRLFSHTDNLSKTLQGKRICAAEGHRLAIQTVKVLKSIRSDEAFDAFYATVLVKKRSLLDIGDPTLKRQRQQPNNLDDYFGYGSSRSHQPTTAAYHYRKQYFEAVDLLVNTIGYRFNQESYKAYEKLECLLNGNLKKSDKSTRMI